MTPLFRPRLLDTTLREGAQAPRVRFDACQSAEIAAALVRLRVDMVECGHPRVGATEAERVRAVIAACGDVPVLAHARARKEDVDAVAATGARWVGIFAGVNPISNTARIPMSRSVYDCISEAVGHAKHLGLMVRFTVEDGSRTDWDDLMLGFKAATDAGADRVCFADTVGLLCPWEVEEMVRRLRGALQTCELEVHLHNDRGMADANALGAIRGGAHWISCSLNGIGERCGITDTILLLANLASLGWREWPAGVDLQRASRLTEMHSRIAVSHGRPVVGRDAFTHVARLHQLAVQRDERAYAWTLPALLGRESSTSPIVLPARADQLVHHAIVDAAGGGATYLLIDERVVPDSRQSCVVRRVGEYGLGCAHLEPRRNAVDGLLVFLGDGPALGELTVEVTLGRATLVLKSPGSVFVPAGLLHGFEVVEGTGVCLSHVLTGDLESTILTSPRPSSDTRAHARPREAGKVAQSALGVVMSFVESRLPHAVVDPSTRLLDVFDSLTFLDFFIDLERAYGDSVSLDAVAACTTFEEVARALSRDDAAVANPGNYTGSP